jgi:uncharacterized protein (DUF2147 family)
MKALSAALVGALLSSMPAFASDAAGVWMSQDGGLKVQLVDCGDRICGHVVWLGEPNDRATGRPKTDRQNPDPNKRARPLIGLPVMKMAPNGRDRWSGTIYNADDGHVYRAHLTVTDAHTAVLEGCMLVVLCRGHTWTRAN